MFAGKNEKLPGDFYMAGTYCGKWPDLHGENGGVKDEHSKNIGTVKIRSSRYPYVRVIRSR